MSNGCGLPPVLQCTGGNPFPMSNNLACTPGQLAKVHSLCILFQRCVAWDGIDCMKVEILCILFLRCAAWDGIGSCFQLCDCKFWLTKKNHSENILEAIIVFVGV